jgi:hypothetical protein
MTLWWSGRSSWSSAPLVLGRARCRVAVASVDGVWAAGHVVDPRAQVTPQPAPVPWRRSRSTPTRSKTTSNARSGGRTHLPHRTGVRLN